MKMFASFAKLDAEERKVYGYASTEALDSQGEVVTKEALKAALPGFMRFANIREMHQPSAVGRAENATVDDKGLYVVVKIEDQAAWAKIKAQVYNGFSIAGTVTDRDPANPHIITGVTLSEISLVDRPANPDAVFDYYKADLTKAGARNSKADLKRIQAIHDQAAELGACCHGQDAADAGADTGDADADPDGGDDEPMGKADDGVTRMIARMDRNMRLLAERIEALETRPLPPRGALKAIGKGEDLGLPAAEAKSDPMAAMKAALAQPRYF
ncbi:MAG TPA: XkdF-like putative serine protease domain-containing protein [Stellaceae bacterium]|jgi:phage head maturation protease|nr:XkdF-like putative serine protease domain-containing protein [Stellaceae bacterium]